MLRDFLPKGIIHNMGLWKSWKDFHYFESILIPQPSGEERVILREDAWDISPIFETEIGESRCVKTSISELLQQALNGENSTFSSQRLSYCVRGYEKE